MSKKIAVIGECMIELSEKGADVKRGFGGDTLNIVGHDVVAAIQGRVGAGGGEQHQAAARARARLAQRVAAGGVLSDACKCAGPQ